MNINAQNFANLYDSLFKNKTHSLKSNEIPLFRAMKDALMGTSKMFDIEEYHGTSYQVRFIGDNINARKNARCELSDLMIVVFSPVTKEVRLTYLQAKSERSNITPSFSSQFSANFEQWYLLSKRPKIDGVGSFNPPKDLLANAIYPSIGTFAFFYKDRLGNFETFYVSAENLLPLTVTKSKKGKVKLNSFTFLSPTFGNKECISSFNNYYFAYHLYNLTIGTPISPKISAMSGIRDWLCEILRTKISEARKIDRPTSIAEELIEILESDYDGNGSGNFGAKYLLILKSNYES